MRHCLPAFALIALAAPAAARPARPAPPPTIDETRWVSLALTTGPRIGWAREHLMVGPYATRLEREEHVVIQRGRATAPLSVITRTTLDGDAAGLALRLAVTSDSGGTIRSLDGVREHGRWRLTARDLTGQSRRWSDGGDAIPRGWLAVLLRLGRLPARPAVLLEDRQGARAVLGVARDGAVVTLVMATRFGNLSERWTVDDAGRVTVAEDDSFRARVVPEATATAAAPPLELLDSLAIPIKGAPAELYDRFRLAVSGLPVPMAAPGQRVVSSRAGTSVLELVTPDLDEDSDLPVATRADLAPTFFEPASAPAVRAMARGAPAGSDWERAVWLSHQVYETLTTKDTFTAPLTATEALAAHRGDCTAHAVLLGALLKASRIPARLATGYIVDERALRRHRWVLAYIGGTWVPLDPLYDEAPARAGHLALAIHGSTAEELMADDLVFAGVRAPRARWIAEP